MSVVSTNEYTEDRRTHLGLPVSRNHVRAFKVLVDDVEDDGVTVAVDNSNIPAIYEEHPNDDGVWCSDIVAKPDANTRLQWRVVCQYSLKPGYAAAGTDAVDDPWDIPPNISFSFEQVSEEMRVAYDIGVDVKEVPTVAIDNSAGDVFDPPLVQNEGSLLIVIQRNESPDDFDVNNLYDYIDTVNDAVIFIAGIGLLPYEAWMRDINAVKAWNSEGTQYWDVTYEVLVDFQTHRRRVLDQGFYTKDSAGVKSEIKINGKAATEPQKLDGVGQQLGVGAAAVYLTFSTYWETDWDPLDLPEDED